VSWFAAKAYCEAKGERLPSVAEWEYTAAASRTQRDATADAEWRSELVAMYSTRSQRLASATPSNEVNVYGVRDLHGKVWEWTEDFDGGMSAHHDHSKMVGGKHMYCASASLGASDLTNYPAFLRAAVRSGLKHRSTMNSLGFRCAA
jgi:formylglycine-generating enzyme required for sulfatase activity